MKNIRTLFLFALLFNLIPNIASAMGGSLFTDEAIVNLVKNKIIQEFENGLSPDVVRLNRYTVSGESDRVIIQMHQASSPLTTSMSLYRNGIINQTSNLLRAIINEQSEAECVGILPNRLNDGRLNFQPIFRENTNSSHYYNSEDDTEESEADNNNEDNNDAEEEIVKPQSDNIDDLKISSISAPAA